MNSTQKPVEENTKKLLANARAIISNQVALPLGVAKMNRIIVWAEATDAFDTIDLNVFKEYADQIDGAPVGTERLQWDKDALKHQEKILDQVNLLHKDAIIDKCFEIIEKFGDKLSL